MTISLTNLIADIEAKIAAANSSTSTDELLKIIKVARAANTIANTYDSSGAMPIDSANVGNILMSASDNFLYVLDSAGGSWSSITGSGDDGGGGGGGFTMLGSSYGYVAGKHPQTDQIQRYSLASDGNATDVGDMISERRQPAGLSSSDAGYRISSSSTTGYNTTEKMLFASEASSSTSAYPYYTSGVASLHSADYGWIAGANAATIDKYAYVADTFSTETPTLAGSSGHQTGASSGSAGYVLGGYPYPTSLGGNAIQKFPFASGAVTESGHLLQPISRGTGTSSDTHGYNAGGKVGPPWINGINSIEKFPFSSDGDATDVGDLIEGKYKQQSSGNQSAASGYDNGGTSPSTGLSNVIQKFPFSADGNATDVGDLVTAGMGQANNFV